MVLCLSFFLLAAFFYHTEKARYTPGAFRDLVQHDFLQREKEVEADRQAGIFGKSLLQTPVAEAPRSYFLFLVRGGSTLFWNSTTVDLPARVKHSPDSFRNGRLTTLPNGAFYIRSHLLNAARAPDSPGLYAYTVVPVLYDYTIANEYFQTHFAAGKRIPPSCEIKTAGGEGRMAILDSGGRPVFYLQVHDTADDIYVVGTRVWIVTIMALLCLAFWIHELCHGAGVRTRRPARGWYLLLAAVALLQLAHELWQLPAGFRNARLFSPELLSSGESVRSLGDFMIDVLLEFWLLVYLLAYVPLQSRRILKYRLADRLVRLAGCFVLVAFLYRLFAVQMRMLVIDSKISFEVSDYRSLTVYTFIGIFTLSVITVNFLVTVGIFNSLNRRLFSGVWFKYLLLILISLLIIFPASRGEPKVFYLAILFMSLAGLLLIDTFGLPMQKRPRQYDLSIAPTAYLWFAILCSWITLEIFYFNYTKEKELRKIFAGKQQQQDDDFIRYSFMDFAEGFQRDTVVQSFFRAPSPEARAAADKYIFYNYLAAYARRYSIAIHYYDPERRPLQERDSANINLMHMADSLHGDRMTSGFANLEKLTAGRHIFWLLCPVPDPQSSDTMGYVAFDISIDKRPKMMNRRSFLEKKNNPTDQHYFDKYAYGIYRNNVLWTEVGSHSFPYINSDRTGTAEFSFRDSLRTSILLYRPSGNEVIKVVYDRDLVTGMVSLFSYVLAVLLVFTGCIFLLRQFLFYPLQTRFFLRNVNFTIRSKVNLTVLSTVFASLLVVGIITLSFISNKYRENQRKSLQNLLLYYSQNILHYSEEHHLDFSMDSTGSPARYADLSYALSTMAEEQGADINLYDRSGKLLATSQLELLKKGLLSRHMQRDVFLTLRRGEQTELIGEERIGDLSYQSVYTPLRDKEDRIFAYVNMPYYASQSELDDEISNVLASLINVYALIFFLSGIFAILISNSIVRSFRLLIAEFSNIRLRHNEYIHWPYKDEIGVLVKAYNAMMRKVEDMASKLARTEREAAWREIARQVAHEIKNPLTPMKLNIQYLQQAISNGRADIAPLASRVSATLIEQIENLNLIASEFSNFAKMPEADPEPLNVRECLRSMADLFQKGAVPVIPAKGDPEIMVYMDKSYFIRVFTNLIQNALQAVDGQERGEVLLGYEQKDNNVVITVKDNGTGIAEELQEKLFVPYFTTKSSGTGLGLPMAKNMVEHSGGHIWFTTVSGKGSVFYVQLPVYYPEKDA